MTLLSERIQKAKRLTFSPIPGTGETLAGTWGSQNDYYQVALFQCKLEVIQVADKSLEVKVISTRCEQQNIKSGKLNPMEDCKGNCRHTVCYHSLGWLKDELSRRNQEISFYEDIFTALNGLNFGGELAKVISKQGEGFVWAVIREEKWLSDFGKNKPETVILNSKTNINLMRGSEDDEGID